MSAVPRLDPEADLHLHLKVGNLSVDDLAAHGRDLEPVEVADGLRGARDTVADRLVHAVRAGADDFGDAVGLVSHGLSSRFSNRHTIVQTPNLSRGLSRGITTDRLDVKV